MKKVLCRLCGIIAGVVLFIGFSGVYATDGTTEGGQGLTPKGGGGSSSSSDIGIKLEGGCLTGMGEGCFKLDYLLWGKDSEIARRNENRTVLTIAQDVVLAATYMVGTVLTIVLIYCGLMYIFSSGGGKDPSKYRKGLIYAAIGACLVWGAYAIVRLIQYIAKG